MFVNMARAQSKVEQGEVTTRNLILVAGQLFSERGYHGVAAEAIVEAAGVSRGALYHHFGGKRGLFEAVFVDCERRIAARIRTAASKEPTPRGQLLAGSLAFLDACADPDLRRIVIEDAPVVLGWPRWRQIDSGHGLALLRNAIERLQEEGEITGHAAEAIVYALSGAMNELAMWVAASGRTRAALKEAKQILIELVQNVGSLAVPETESRPGPRARTQG